MWKYDGDTIWIWPSTYRKCLSAHNSAACGFGYEQNVVTGSWQKMETVSVVNISTNAEPCRAVPLQQLSQMLFTIEKNCRTSFAQVNRAYYTQGDNDVISFQSFHYHLVDKTLINVCNCDIAEIRFVSKLYDHVDISLNQLIQFYFNNTKSSTLKALTTHIILRYTHKMAVVSRTQNM